MNLRKRIVLGIACLVLLVLIGLALLDHFVLEPSLGLLHPVKPAPTPWIDHLK